MTLIAPTWTEGQQYPTRDQKHPAQWSHGPQQRQVQQYQGIERAAKEQDAYHEAAPGPQITRSPALKRPQEHQAQGVDKVVAHRRLPGFQPLNRNQLPQAVGPKGAQGDADGSKCGPHANPGSAPIGHLPPQFRAAA